MAQIWYGHFDSTEDDERILLAEDWARYIRSFVSDGVRNGGTCLQVSADGGTNVKIDTGIASIQGYIFYLDEDYTGRYYSVPVSDANPSLNRIDRLILRLDRTIQNRAIIPMVLTGEASASPAPPALTRNENIYELSLARIYVKAGVLQIYEHDITDERFDQEVCGLMHSVLGLDSSAWQAQFDAFMAQIGTAFTDAQNDRDNNWQGQMASQEAQFETFMDGAQSDLAVAAGFDFWNTARLPGNYYLTQYPADGSIVTTIRKTVGDTLVAAGVTSYPADGSVVYEETVYQADGVTIQRHTIETTTYAADGSIMKEVQGLYD